MKKMILSLLFSILLLNVAGCRKSTTKKKEKQSFEVSDLIRNADEYIRNNADTVIDEYRNTYHLMPPVGWMNDPNGFSEFDSKFHLFYQYNPYDAVWGPMHWGHQTTTDFIKWTLEDTALAPDMEYDSSGCFSGTAIEVDGVHYLVYTAVTDVQNQGMAYSYDGVTYKKLDDLILSGKDLPEGFSNADFRDPKIFERDGKYYILLGNKAGGNKQIIMFSSDSITGPYEYKGVVYSRKDLGGIFECPDLVTIDGMDVLIASPQSIGSDDPQKFQNADSCVYLIGNLSVNTNRFYSGSNQELEEFDKGFSFYAPQTMTTSDGRKILIAWMRSWAEPNVTRSDGWCGAMTLPRELKIIDGHIYQSPVREVYGYMRNEVTSSDITLENETRTLESFSGSTSRITLSIDVSSMNSGKAGIEVFKGEKYYTRIYYDASKGYVVFDRNHSGTLMDGVRYAAVEPVNEKINLEIFLDVNSVEVFINGGYYTMTGTTYSNKSDIGVALFSENCTASFSNLSKADILVE